ncbi:MULTISPECIES: AI-2E family transporter [Rhodococcus]|uniref:AI-2E family transporter n=1 Tax=Rhodococcus oxybenzonivorans TaxID=1990687 RepID=A0AAE4UXU5_9NOCA|nr:MULTISPECIES: AI-2E family transporter [Rhodococcus]MDV7246560.1 AI-2E family transporter [Rhodococcus oxybenzonivorans]MDV7264556.1 AI-2E family transporter [Rhodococcus oxybenzonivorans]MDV7278182.1 AI-2E family transporter [Rhodococcus oxybenzonivorans]MDV7337505.1 AI-2E family transporter [Rhodococcus oxybenzonivorans]MDV7347770.1 AI-2E family transporter [Rhodococcus oxybenzonivorans]
MAEQEAPAAPGQEITKPDRGHLIGLGGMWLAKWSLVLVAIALGALLFGWIIEKLWVIVLPVLLAIVVCTVLWPPTRAMTKRSIPPAAAAATTLVLFIAVLAGVIAGIVPSVVSQAPELANKATEGINQVQDWLQGPPINLKDDQIDEGIHTIIAKVQESGTVIASGVFTGVSTASSLLLTLGLVLVLSFFFIKDGPRFIPWLHSVSGGRAGRHLEVVLGRMWDTLGGFIRTQALVSLIDAVFIGAGLLILGVPLAPVLAILTFIGGFIPIVGAFVAGALAVLVALVANGLTTAVIVLIIILVVQQIEGNVLQPVLQSKSMKLHAVVVLLAVTAGASVFGIVGAFLAVPTAAVAAVVVRYIGEQIDEKSAEANIPDDVAADEDIDDAEREGVTIDEAAVAPKGIAPKAITPQAE